MIKQSSLLLLCSLLGAACGSPGHGSAGHSLNTKAGLERKHQELKLWSRKLAQKEAALNAREAALPAGKKVPTVGKEVLVFEEDFSTFDLDLWKHELTMGGGGNWEFEYYTNNRTNSFTEDGVLYLQPTLAEETFGKDEVLGHVPTKVDMWGSNPGDYCTSNMFYGCFRESDASLRRPLNPIQSARVRTAGTFSYKYGRLEIEAKLPRGDWLWPAIWLLPEHNAYGQWPSSGEIDLMESRGNAPGYVKGGYDSMSSCLHWGPYFLEDAWSKTYEEYKLPEGTFNDDFHIFGLAWSEDGLYTYVDSPDNKVLTVDFSKQSFWERGEFSKVGANNPWEGRPNAAPFDQSFYLVFNVAVGGLSGFFLDGHDGKPWTNKDVDAAYKFLEAKELWYPTWKSRESALQIKSVRLWQDKASDDIVGSEKYHAEAAAEATTTTTMPAAGGPAAVEGKSHHGFTWGLTLTLGLIAGLITMGIVLYKKRASLQYQSIQV